MISKLEITAQLSRLPSSQLGHVCATSRLRPLQLIRISGDEWDSESLEKPVTDWPRHPAITSEVGPTKDGPAEVLDLRRRSQEVLGEDSLLFFLLFLTHQMSDRQQQEDLQPASSCWLCSILVGRWENFLSRGTSREEAWGGRTSVFGGKWDRWTLA